VPSDILNRCLTLLRQLQVHIQQTELFLHSILGKDNYQVWIEAAKMRLLKRNDDGNIALEGPFEPGTIPPYAILSHTWGREECNFKDLCDGTGRDKVGFDKIKFCVQQAEKMGLEYSWVDTCCIDKTNAVEHSTAINSMFLWYQNSKRCFAYL